MSASPSPLLPLVVRDVVKTYADRPGRPVLDCIGLVVSPGEVVGLIGENGAGKSTLLRIVAGRDRPDSGSVSFPGDLGYVGQDVTHPPGTTVGDVLAAALHPLHEAVARLEELAERLATAGPDEHDEYASVLEWCTFHDAWDADRRAQLAADRLGVGKLEADRPVARLSGGQRSRLELAALIARRPTCVVLDEPTNHLDSDGLELLEEFLGDLPGVVLVASHDRTFLDNTCSAVVDLDPAQGGATRFTGSFSDYLATKRAARAQWQRDFEAQRAELGVLREAARTRPADIAHDRAPRDGDKYIYGFKGARVDATVRRRRRNAEQRIEALERDLVPKPPAELSFGSPLTGERTAAATLRDVVVAGRLRLDRLDVHAGEHLLVTGGNGSGKTTLLQLLAGQLAPDEGAVLVSAAEIGFLAQDVVWRHPDRSVQALFRALAPEGASLRALGLVHPREHARPIGLLSTGQQRRLALAVLVARQPDLLLLDEPTNHISLALASELEESLGRSPGTVVVATHDRWLRQRWEGPELAL